MPKTSIVTCGWCERRNRVELKPGVHRCGNCRRILRTGFADTHLSAAEGQQPSQADAPAEPHAPSPRVESRHQPVATGPSSLGRASLPSEAPKRGSDQSALYQERLIAIARERDEQSRQRKAQALRRGLALAAALSLFGLGYRYTSLKLSPDGRIALVEYCAQEIEGMEDTRTGMITGGGCLEKEYVPKPLSVWFQDQLSYTFGGFVAFFLLGYAVFLEKW